jgi:hypothetical protein
VTRGDVRVRLERVGRHSPRDPGKNGREVGIVRARDDAAIERDLVGEVDERLLQVVEAAIVVKMLVVDVRHHRNRW